MDISEIVKIANDELAQERKRDAIDAIKVVLKNKKQSFWHKIFPFTIRIERRK